MHDALIDNIKSLLAATVTSPILIVIDGPAGAGKTTLAATILDSLPEVLGTVIHCDDLYNGWDDALTPTLARNLHEWVLEPIRHGAMPRYQKYDWLLGSYQSEIQIPESSVVILEGVGAALASVTELAQLSIWIDIPAEIGLERVLRRDGMHITEEMLRWIGQQQMFFEENRNRENCSIHIPYGAPAR